MKRSALDTLLIPPAALIVCGLWLFDLLLLGISLLFLKKTNQDLRKTPGDSTNPMLVRCFLHKDHQPWRHTLAPPALQRAQRGASVAGSARGGTAFFLIFLCVSVSQWFKKVCKVFLTKTRFH